MIKVNTCVAVWNSLGKQMFPNLLKDIPAGSYTQRGHNEEFLTLDKDYRWVKKISHCSDCTGMATWIEYIWDIEPKNG